MSHIYQTTIHCIFECRKGVTRLIYSERVKRHEKDREQFYNICMDLHPMFQVKVIITLPLEKPTSVH